MRRARRRTAGQATTTWRHHPQGAETPATTGNSANRVTQHRSPQPPDRAHRHRLRSPSGTPSLRSRPSAASRTLSKSPCQIAVRSLRNCHVCRGFRAAEDAISGDPYRKVRSPARTLRKGRKNWLFAGAFPCSPPDLSEKYEDLPAKFHAPLRKGSRHRAPPTTRPEPHGRAAQRLDVELWRVPAPGMGLVVARSQPAHPRPLAPRRLSPVATLRRGQLVVRIVVAVKPPEQRSLRRYVRQAPPKRALWRGS